MDKVDPGEIDDVESEKNPDPEKICKNCHHLLNLHNRECEFHKEEESDSRCGCNLPEHHIVIASNKYMGWEEIHCEKCGNLLCFINNIENIFDYNILCSSCIETVYNNNQ